MAEQTQAALVELVGAVDEVGGELETLANRVAELEGSDGTLAEDIRAQAVRLRGLRADAPVDPEPPVA